MTTKKDVIFQGVIELRSSILDESGSWSKKRDLVASKT